MNLLDDKIGDFLHNKLEQIKATNERLTNQLKERQKFLKNLDSVAMETDDQSATVTVASKKIFYDHLIVCLEIQNFGVYPLDDLNLTLTSNLQTTQKYETYLYEISEPQHSVISSFLTDHPPLNCLEISETLRKTKKVIKQAYFLVKLQIPSFIDKLEAHFKGAIFYQQQFNPSDKILTIPPFQVHLEDLQKPQHLVDFNNFQVVDLLGVMLGMTCFSLTMILPQNWATSIDTTFEIHCSFVKLPISSKCRKYFWTKKISEQINDCLVVVHAASSKTPNIYPVKIHAKNSTILIHTIHHLHKSIKDVLILPEFYHNRYICKETKEEEYTKSQLTSFLENESQLVLDFLDKIKLDPDLLTAEEVTKFRCELAKLESVTDLEHLKLLQFCD